MAGIYNLLAWENDETIEHVIAQLERLKDNISLTDVGARCIVEQFLNQGIEDARNYQSSDMHHYHTLSLKTRDELYDLIPNPSSKEDQTRKE